MSQSYNLIATIYCKHNYFEDGIFKTLNFTIAEGSIRLMKDLGIVFKYFSGGFHLLSANTDLLALENEENSLKINLYCNDPYYINYTSLTNSFNPAKDLLYFNNLKPGFSKNDESGNDNFYLHDEEFVSKSDIKGLNQNTTWKKPMATIELFIKALSNDFIRNEKEIIYGLNFNTNMTKWKYFLVDPIYQKFNNLEILQKNNGVVFKKAVKTEIQGTNALIIESENEIPLLEFSKDIYQLKGYDTTIRENKLIIKSLPHASPEQLYFEPSNTIDEATPSKKNIYSHIFM